MPFFWRTCKTRLHSAGHAINGPVHVVRDHGRRIRTGERDGCLADIVNRKLNQTLLLAKARDRPSREVYDDAQGDVPALRGS